MNKGVIAAAVVAALAAGGGYWAGQKNSSLPHAEGPASMTADAGKKERKVLFYRNPMGLPDTSPTPKKDPMGMDYIPVYEGEQDDEPASANQIKISTEKIQKLGVRTKRQRCVTWTRLSGRPVELSPTSAAPMPSRPNSKAMLSVCMSM
jgi:hypothetical protein